jgi:uncharacterized membrane protein
MSVDCGLTIHLLARPGQYVEPGQPVLILDRAPDDAIAHALQDTVVVGGERQFDGDPRFGLIVLSEIASRALSPGINDPGTAIDVIGTSVRALADWSDALRCAAPDLRFPDLRVVPIKVEDVLEDAFRWIARDGAGLLEVQIRLQKGLATLAAHDPAMFGDAARHLSGEALDRAARAMDLPRDVERLRAVAGRLN